MIRPVVGCTDVKGGQLGNYELLPDNLGWEDAYCKIASTEKGITGLQLTTRVTLEVLDAMLPYCSELWGNPSIAYRLATSHLNLKGASGRTIAVFLSRQQKNPECYILE